VVTKLTVPWHVGTPMRTSSTRRLVATKLYGYDWWPAGEADGDPYEAVADALAEAGTSLALVQNRIDPVPASDVEQLPPGGEYDDLRLREELRERGIRCFEAISMFFQPAVYRHRPDLRPVGADGAEQVQLGWYVGLCPSSEEYLEQRARRLQRVTADLHADGLFLDFIRFPGFWEMWTPGTDRAAIREYCFCARCRQRFGLQTGIKLPDDLGQAAAILQGPLRAVWTAWKCELIATTVRRVREAVTQVAPETEIMINLVPPFIGGGLDGVSEDVLGQRIESLATVAEHFSVMVYHQILKRRPGDWIPEVVTTLRNRTARTVIPCLQVRPTYLDGIYAQARRRPDIGPEEFRDCVDSVAASPADGIMTYHWSDVLAEDAVTGGQYSAALREFGRVA
jgi:hypothetical protein